MPDGPVTPIEAVVAQPKAETPRPIEAPPKEREPLIPVPEAVEKTPEQGLTVDGYRSEERADQVREQLEAERNPYPTSTLVEKLKHEASLGHNPKIAFLDIDSTLSGNPAEAVRVRQLLEQQGYGVVFVTSRTEEMVMSGDAFKKSGELNRPAPHLGTEGDKRTPAFADEVPDFAGLYDPDVIAATTGSQIWVRGKAGGYETDPDFVRQTRNETNDWRSKTGEIIKIIDPNGVLGKMAPIDVDIANFEAGVTDVYPPETRFQLNFEVDKQAGPAESTGLTERGAITHEDGRVQLAMKQEYVERIRALRNDPNTPPEIKRALANTKITDDSNPEKGKYAIYLTPNKGNKSRAVEDVVIKIAKQLGIDKTQMEALMVGDSFPDVGMGLYGGTGTKATFLIVGGSRLTDAFTNPDTNEFAGKGISAVSNRLYDKGHGEMGFVAPLTGERRVVVGDKAFPGTKGPETVRAYLEQQAT